MSSQYKSWVKYTATGLLVAVPTVQFGVPFVLDLMRDNGSAPIITAQYEHRVLPEDHIETTSSTSADSAEVAIVPTLGTTRPNPFTSASNSNVSVTNPST